MSELKSDKIEYTEGVASDGACILKNGSPMKIDEILKELNSKTTLVEYKDHEFCTSVRCLWGRCSGCDVYANKCVYRAKEFHQWIKAKGYRIVKDGNNVSYKQGNTCSNESLS